MNVIETTDVHHSLISSTLTDTTQMYTKKFLGAGHIYGTRQTFMDIFGANQYTHYKNSNLYYPFTSKAEWQLRSWVLQSNLSMQAVDKFLHLNLISLIYLCFISNVQPTSSGPTTYHFILHC